MKFRFVGCARVTGLALIVVCLIPAFGAAQSAPAPAQVKKVPTGYGLDKDQPFAGADPNGTGLPWREPPRGGRGGKERPNSAFGRWTSRPDRILGAGGLGLRRHFGIG